MIRSKEQHEELMRKCRERNLKKKLKAKDNRSRNELINEITQLKYIINQKNIKIKELNDKIKYFKSNNYIDNKPYLINNDTISHSINIVYKI